jgi:tRNA (cytidine/uridine-2'-O-)-methyltransferase
MRLALFQPDIPQNLGGAVRLSACFGAPLDVIEPCGFPLSDRAVRRASLDYGPMAQVLRHSSWSAFLGDAARAHGRLVLFTTKGAVSYLEFAFKPSDTLIFGRESAGAPAEVHDAADARLVIPVRPGARSLNLVTAAAVALAEALRQTGGFATISDGAPD